MPTQGNCDLCGEWSGHLEEGACPGCIARHQPAGAQPAAPVVHLSLLADSRLTARDLRVWMAAMQHRDPKAGVFRAGYRALCQTTGLRISRVCEAVGRLERRGWVRRERVGRRVHLTLEGPACV